MDDAIIRQSTNNDLNGLTKTLSSAKKQELVELLDGRIARAKGDPVAFLRAVVKGSPFSDPAGLKRCLFTYKHVIQLLNEGDVSKKVAMELIGFLLMEIDSIPGRALADLADNFLEAIKSGAIRNGNSLQLFPKILSAIASKKSIPMEGDCGGEMTGAEFKSHLLNTLCSSRWDPQCIIHLVPMFREIPLTSEELKFVIEKILRLLKDLDIQELPPMVYQLLLLSTKGYKHLVLDGITSHFDYLDNACRKEGDEEDLTEVQSIPKEQLHRTEGTVLLHISFAIKQDQDLAREFIKYIKAHQTCPGNILTRPFNLALAISVAQIQGFEDTIFDFLKSAIFKSFKDEERKRQSKWVKDNFPEEIEVEERILEIVQSSSFGWDHVTQGLVQLGFTLMDAFGPKASEPAASTLTSKQQSCQLGARILFNTYKVHEFVRAETLQQILNRLITMATSPVTHYVDLLTDMVSSAPHALRDCLPKVKEALDHLSFLPLNSARGLLKAIQPLLKISASLRDSLMLVLRKALFSRQSGARLVAVSGFLQILKSFKVLGASFSSSQPCSQPSSQPLSQSSQVQVDCHVRGSTAGAEGLCLEILGNLRRCLAQQGDVRMLLYEGLYEVLCRNPRLRQPILHLLFSQFQKYYEPEDDVTPPVKLDPCLTASGEQIFLSEPVGHLLFYLQHCTAKCVESNNADDDDDNDDVSVEHALNELEEMFQSLVRRMIKAELEDFELDKSADFSLNNSVGVKNNIFARLVLGMYEALLEYCFMGFDFSIESTDEILQLLENYRLLSDMTKEKAGAAGKRGRSPGAKQETHSFFAFSSLVSLLKSLFNDTIPSHQQSLTALRGSADFVRYILNGVLQKLREVNEGGVCSGPGGGDADLVFKQCCSAARVLLKQLNGETCFQEDPAKKSKGRKIFGLCLDGYCLALSIICCRYPDRLAHFLQTIDRSRDNTADQCESFNSQELVCAHIKTFQQRITSAILSSDEDNDVTMKDAQPLVHVMSLLSQHLDPADQQFAQLHMWLHRMCADHNIDDPALTKAMVSLLFALTLQCKSSSGIIREVAQDIHSQLGDVDEEVEVEDKTHLAIINPRTAAPTVMLLLLGHAEKILEEIEWTIARLKGDLTAPSSRADSKLPESPGSTQRDSLEHALCQRFTALVAAFHELSQSAVPVGTCSENALKVLNKLYGTLGSLTKYYLTLYNQKIGHLPAKFEKLVKLSGTHLAQQVYALITYIQAAQAQLLHDLSAVGKGKGKKKGAATKGLDHVGKARVMKEMKSIPNLIYSIEQYERYLIQLSKKCKINLMEHFKRSTARDFRINGTTLEAALRENSSDEDDDEDDDEKGSGSEEEPPVKKGKLVEPKAKNSKFSLKHKGKASSKQPLAEANT